MSQSAPTQGGFGIAQGCGDICRNKVLQVAGVPVTDSFQKKATTNLEWLQIRDLGAKGLGDAPSSGFVPPNRFDVFRYLFFSYYCINMVRPQWSYEPICHRGAKDISSVLAKDTNGNWKWLSRAIRRLGLIPRQTLDLRGSQNQVSLGLAEAFKPMLMQVDLVLELLTKT